MNSSFVMTRNVVSVGSLLSGLLLEPLYLTSIIVGMNNYRVESGSIIEFDEVLQRKQYLDSLQRSLYDRICDLSSQLQSPFRANQARNLKLIHL